MTKKETLSDVVKERIQKFHEEKDLSPEKDFSREAIEIIGEFIHYGKYEEFKDFISLENISLDYIQKKFYSEFVDAFKAGSQGTIYHNLGKKEEAKECFEQGKFTMYAEAAIKGMIVNPEINQTPEFISFFTAMQNTDFSGKPKPTLSIVR